MAGFVIAGRGIPMSNHITYLDSLKLAAQATKGQLDLTTHRGEEGRHIEGIVRGVLEKLLPKRFSIGSGFVINFEGGISTQQDVVLFDNYNNAPLLYEGSAGLFTAESVYATIEVKKTLNARELKKTATKINGFRKVTRKKLTTTVQTTEQKRADGARIFSPVTLLMATDVPPRSYLLAMDASWKKFSTFKDAVEKVCNDTGTHFHGVCVLEKDWFAYRVAHKTPAQIKGSKGNALAALYQTILENSASFVIHPANLSAYFDVTQGRKLWNKLSGDSET